VSRVSRRSKISNRTNRAGKLEEYQNLIEDLKVKTESLENAMDSTFAKYEMSWK
jgi:hypothetical protein